MEHDQHDEPFGDDPHEGPPDRNDEGPPDDGSHEGDEPEDALPSRSLARVRGRWLVRVEGDDRDRFALDLSVGGMFLGGLTRPVGSRLALTLTLSEGTLSTGATVRWARAGQMVPRPMRGVGLAFDPLAEEDRARLLAEIGGEEE